MKTTVIYAHPWSGSFNRAMLDRVTASLQQEKTSFHLIDLNGDGFNPVLSEKELALYGQGKSADPLVARYNRMLDETDRVILIFPVWWYDMPAVLRGFFDKVMLTGSAYGENETGMYALRNIGKTILFTSSAASTEELVEEFGDPVNGTIIRGTFRFIGFNNAVWHNLGRIHQSSPAQREEFLAAVPSRI